MSRKILFIVNPKAGKRMSEEIIEIIRAEFPQNIYYHIAIWKDKSHFEEIIEIMRTGDYTDVVAVGGDGTANRVAAALIGTDVNLGIVPVGSGNGLARSLGLSMQADEVIRELVQGERTRIDVGYVNDIPFFCTSGIGFDAHIGALFASSVKRGLQSYIRIIIRELLRYRAKAYSVRMNGMVFSKKAFLITVANAGQYGNDFYIAPQADLQDGLFHVVILRPFNVFKATGLMHRILSRKAFLARSIETHSSGTLVIECEEPQILHYDGEPGPVVSRAEYRLMPKALNVITGKKFVPVSDGNI